MLENHYLSINVRAFLERSTCPASLKDVRPILEEIWDNGPETRGNLNHDIKLFLGLDDEAVEESVGDERQLKKLINIPPDILEVLDKKEEQLKKIIPGWSRPLQAVFESNITVRGDQYNRERDHDKGYTAFIRPVETELPTPAVIVEIFSVFYRKLSGSRYTKLEFVVFEELHTYNGTDDPFKEFPDFGCRLWSSERKNPDISLAANVQSHAIFCTWKPEVFAIKSLARVSQTFVQNWTFFLLTFVFPSKSFDGDSL